MKNKILIIAIIIVMVAISAYLIFFNNSDNEEKIITKTDNVEITNVYDVDETIEWSDYEGNEIELNGSIKIEKGGVYTLSGSIEDGLILIDTDDEVKLILNNVSIKSSNSPAILVENAALVEIELIGENYLEDGSSYISDYSDYNGVIFSKDDLIIGGTGKLTIKANKGDGIVSKDNLKITDGTFIIEATDDAIKGKDSLYIIDGNFEITSLGDALKATNDKDEELGYVYIKDGTFKIESNGDGIQAETNILIENGSFDIKTSGSSDDSLKGIKAGASITINGGDYNLNTADDSIHANGNTIINNGTFKIDSADDGIHADAITEINGGTISIDAGEGIEGTYVRINDGNIKINASDDGINAAKKSDEYTPTVEINGGNIEINMASGDTDGVDANGDIVINGGTISVSGQSTFDYDGTGTINGGTVICNGEKVTTLSNQFMGGGPGGGMPQGGPNGNMPQRDQRNRY